jgi:ferredoxin
MPTVVFLGPGSGADKTRATRTSVDVPNGGALVDVCDEAGAPIPFSCRTASCATCRVVVLTGAELLAPAHEEEATLLAFIKATPDERLACQATLLPGPGLVTLRSKPLK